jgi:hypothetical protein
MNLPLVADGVHLSDFPIGVVIEVTTANRTYTIENRGEGRMLISGHPKYCPEPVLVDQVGPLIAPGLCLAWWHPNHGRIRTSPVEQISPRPKT